jgi:hypothetical protein
MDLDSGSKVALGFLIPGPCEHHVGVSYLEADAAAAVITPR